MNKKIGVFLSRMQPIHIGHLGIIEKALSENDKVLIIIGSKNKKETMRNPFNVTIRREILEESLVERFGENYKDKIIITELPDWSMETDLEQNLEWGRYLYYNIVSIIEQKNFSIYFSDEKEIIEAWFEDSLKSRIDFRLFERNKMFEAVSSTKIRQAFLDCDKDYVENSCPKAVFRRYDELKEIIENVNKNPKNDFSM